MPDYKKPYFQLFCILCDTIEELEQLLADDTIPAPSTLLLKKRILLLRKAQQETEELLIQE